MPKFRKKPIIIEAMQFDGTYECALEIQKWSQGKVTPGFEEDRVRGGMFVFAGYLEVPTLEGTMRTNFSDWVIQGVAGEFYPCKEVILQASYDAIE